jgi:putative transposase
MRGVTLTEGEFYHVYNRGVDKRKIFTSPVEYRRFLRYLYVLNDAKRVRLTYTFHTPQIDEAKPRQCLVAIGAFCLMPNHFHLYATPLVESGLSKFMHRLQTAYTMYFNQRHERTGALLQGTFKANHVEREEYAKYLFSYIHLNPAKIVDPNWKEFDTRDFNKVREYIRDYPYSSLGEYMKKRYLITNPSAFPNYFSRSGDLDTHIDEWLTYRYGFDEV